MNLSFFDYELPAAAIAQAPTARRDDSRLLLIDRGTGRIADHRFTDLVDLLRPDDCVVLNNSRVIPARVLARTAAQRSVELLFIEPVDARRWRALVRPGQRAHVGAQLRVGGEPGLGLGVVGVEADGARVIEPQNGTISELLDLHGLPPLPPYIARHSKPTAEDWDRYQTIYARSPGSVAAPTAGLHFTPTLLDGLKQRGIEVQELTLHVGAATFRPIRATRVDDHALSPERVTITTEVAEAVNRARAAGRRVVAVGTTTTRALEGVADADGRVRPREGTVDLYVTPGHRFRIVDALLTNFHLPRSSLLVLVVAFGSRDLVLRAYRHALTTGYRFYSYGDATLFI